MTVVVTTGDARLLPFPDDSIDLICTSPPFWSLRKYAPGVDDVAVPIGAELGFRNYIAALIACTAEMARVLKPSGSIFVNMGDKYGPNKSLLLLPERYRVTCTDELGLIARAVIVWSKPNGLPESVRDRVRRSHEDWVHLTKSPRYFEAVDEIREPHATHLPDGRPAPRARYGGTMPSEARGDATPAAASRALGDGRADGHRQSMGRAGSVTAGTHALGKLPGSVWSIPTQPLRVPAELNVDHFAAFPMEWPRRLITGWCPREVCTACGEGRRPVNEETGRVVSSGNPNEIGGTAENRYAVESGRGDGLTALIRTATGRQLPKRERVPTGYACACPDTSAPSTPGIVLDPFGGTGTTGLVADVLGRTGISLDASADYGRIAAWRTTDPRQRARAAA